MSAKVLCLLGPTGAGKTEAALALAGRFAGTVINFDSRQVYRELPITTAQPSQEEQARCPHLLYGFLESGEALSAWKYAELAKAAIADVHAASGTPILVGGTGLYLRALLEGMSPIPQVPEEVRARLTEDWLERGPEEMHARLRAVDPAYAARIHPHDRQRVTRALEVHAATGTALTQWHASNTGALGLPILKLGIRTEKDALHRRLARRIEIMMERGALQEVERAVSLCPDRNAPGMTGIGCAELAAHLRGDMRLVDATWAWLGNTKAYAKRQVTWFKKDPDILWFDAEDVSGMTNAAELWLKG